MIMSSGNSNLSKVFHRDMEALFFLCEFNDLSDKSELNPDGALNLKASL